MGNNREKLNKKWENFPLFSHYFPFKNGGKPISEKNGKN